MTEKAQKADLSPVQRLMRLAVSTLDPRAWAHGFKVLNYYNYSHVQELRAAYVGSGVRIAPTASFSNGKNITIKDRARIGEGASLWAGVNARIIVGEDTLIAPNVMITAANYRFNDGSPINAQAMDETDIVIGRDVWVGNGTTVLSGATIGDRAIISAGAVIRGAIPENAVVSGNPASVVGYRTAENAAGAASTQPTALTGALNLSILGAVRQEMPGLDDGQMSTPLEDNGVDSFDLITLRTGLENRFKVAIPDAEWSGLTCLDDIGRLPSLAAKVSGQETAMPVSQQSNTPTTPPASQGPGQPGHGPTAPGSPQHFTSPGKSLRRYTVNMPQMALSGLGESWLFKEIGDVHWNMITDFLQSPSSAIADDQGDRLYATFTRLMLEVEPNLYGFKENSALDIDSTLERYGASFFFGHHRLTGSAGSGKAVTMSTFAKYGEHGNNTSLIKGSPTIVDHDNVPSLAEFPALGVEYRQRRAADEHETIFTCEYEILPPHDINGVGLLYFAAYPTIFDLCLEQAEGKGFLMGHSTVSKDICYYANSDPDDTLLFRLHSRRDDEGLVHHHASLCRSADGKRMAEAHTVKRKL